MYYTDIPAEFIIRPHTLVLTYLNMCITDLLRTSNLQYMSNVYKQNALIR